MIWRVILLWLLGIVSSLANVPRHFPAPVDWRGRGAENPLGKTTYYTNDAAQRLVAVTDPLQRPTLLGYDDDSHQITSKDAAGDLTAQFWDARGDMVETIDAATNTMSKAYDGANNLIYLTNRNGKLWTFQYDGAHRLTNTISPLGHSSSQMYNNRGLLQSRTDPLNNATTYGYDARGRMIYQTNSVRTNGYQYDGNNNLTLLTNLGAGLHLGWVYDAYNRPTSFTNAAGYVIQYRYDAGGNMTNLIYPGNLTVNYYYDSNNRLTNVADWLGHQTAIAYDLAGHVTSLTRPNNTVRLTSYDNDGELTNIVEETTTKFPICFYTLNYNLAGRVQWEFKGPLPHSNAPPTRTMTYDADNRLNMFNSTSVSVDNDGRLTYGPGTNNTFGTYAYDACSELTSAGGLEYGYDPAGNRTFLTNGAAITTFVVNPQGSQVLMRMSGGITNYYIYGQGLLYEIDVTATGTSTAYYHYDCRGSTIALTDSNGNPTDVVEYSPYGTTTYRYGTNTTPFLYNGRFGVQTDVNGLLYMRARYYNPYISRFINADPSGFNGGLNFYAFCNDNPVSAEDPFGLDEFQGWVPPLNITINPNVNVIAQTYLTSPGDPIPTQPAPYFDPTQPTSYIMSYPSDGLSPQSVFEVGAIGAAIVAQTVISGVVGDFLMGAEASASAETSIAQQTGTILWSGPGAQDAASWLANSTGGVTLEMTPLGAQTELSTIGMDYLTQAKPIWQAASQQFVQNASGEVTIVLSQSANPSSIYFTTEWPALLQNPNITGVKFIIIP